MLIQPREQEDTLVRRGAVDHAISPGAGELIQSYRSRPTSLVNLVRCGSTSGRLFRAEVHRCAMLSSCPTCPLPLQNLVSRKTRASKFRSTLSRVCCFSGRKGRRHRFVKQNKTTKRAKRRFNGDRVEEGRDRHATPRKFRLETGLLDHHVPLSFGEMGYLWINERGSTSRGGVEG